MISDRRWWFQAWKVCQVISLHGADFCKQLDADSVAHARQPFAALLEEKAYSAVWNDLP